jgi:hypothetical protein
MSLQEYSPLCQIEKSGVMEEFKIFDTVSQYNAFYNNDTLHPLVSVVDFSKSGPQGFFNMWLGFYAIILKGVKCREMNYGRSFYD